MSSWGTTGRFLTKLDNDASGKRMSMQFKTPLEERIGKFELEEHEKKDDSRSWETSADGVDVWNVKNFKA